MTVFSAVTPAWPLCVLFVILCIFAGSALASTSDIPGQNSSELPTEIIENILGHLRRETSSLDLLLMGHVCWRWLACARRLFWQEVDVCPGFTGYFTSPDYLSIGVRQLEFISRTPSFAYGGLVHKLSLIRSVSNDYSHLLCLFPNIRILRLHQEGFTSLTFTDMISQLSKHRRISHLRVTLSFESARTLNPPVSLVNSVRHLSLGGITDDFQVLEEVLRVWFNVHTLVFDFSDIQRFSGPGPLFRHLQLRTLFLRSFPLGPLGAFLANMPNLVTLTILDVDRALAGNWPHPGPGVVGWGVPLTFQPEIDPSDLEVTTTCTPSLRHVRAPPLVLHALLPHHPAITEVHSVYSRRNSHALVYGDLPNAVSKLVVERASAAEDIDAIEGFVEGFSGTNLRFGGGSWGYKHLDLLRTFLELREIKTRHLSISYGTFTCSHDNHTFSIDDVRTLEASLRRHHERHPRLMTLSLGRFSMARACQFSAEHRGLEEFCPWTGEEYAPELEFQPAECPLFT